MKISKQEGQSLLEVLTALGVAILVIVGLSALAVWGLRSAQHGRNTETATRLAGQAIEQVRTIRDRQTWSNFRDNYAVDSCYTIDTSNWILVVQGSCGGVTFADPFSNFSREVKLTDSSTAPGVNDGRKITVTVFWTDSTGQNQVDSNTILTQWK